MSEPMQIEWPHRWQCGCFRGAGIEPGHVQRTLGYSPADMERLNLRGAIVRHGDGMICADSLTRLMSGVGL